MARSQKPISLVLVTRATLPWAALLVFLVVSSPTSLLGGSTKAERRDRVVHQLELVDPVTPSEPAKVYDLLAVRDEKGFLAEYRLALKTPICVDQQCQEVDVTMVWNAWGYFERLECLPNKPLTKREHALFTAEDYAKLDRILKDRQSILQDFEGWNFFHLDRPLADGLENVDAITSATPVTVQNSVVEDAAYTSWALWHWANGQIVPLLRELTEQRCTPDYLNHLLASEDQRLADFALNYAIEHHPLEEMLVDHVFHLLETGERGQVSRCLDFLSLAIPNKQKRHRRLIDSCCRMRPTEMPIVLQRLCSEPKLPATTYEELTARLDKFPYFPVHLILKTLEERKFSSPATVTDVAKLLESDDFFIARRAFEHLEQQQLDDPLNDRLTSFRKQHRDRL